MGGQQHMKRCSTSRMIRKMQIKTTMRLSPHSGQNGHHQKVYRQLMLEGCGENRTLLHCWWEYKLIQPLWKMVWSLLKKLAINAGEGVEKREPSYINAGNVNRYSHYGEQYGDSLKNEQ